MKLNVSQNESQNESISPPEFELTRSLNPVRSTTGAPNRSETGYKKRRKLGKSDNVDNLIDVIKTKYDDRRRLGRRVRFYNGNYDDYETWKSNMQKMVDSKDYPLSNISSVKNNLTLEAQSRKHHGYLSAHEEVNRYPKRQQRTIRIKKDTFMTTYQHVKYNKKNEGEYGTDLYLGSPMWHISTRVGSSQSSLLGEDPHKSSTQTKDSTDSESRFNPFKEFSLPKVTVGDQKKSDMRSKRKNMVRVAKQKQTKRNFSCKFTGAQNNPHTTLFSL